MTPLALSTVAAVSSATVGGAYLVFSTMVLPAFDRLGSSAAADAMRSVNAAAERPPFLTLFFGSAVAAAAVVVSDLSGDDDGALRAARLVGAGLVLSGFALTIVRNVPLNRRLASTVGGDAWPRYRGPWMRANTVRAVASVAGAALLMVGTPR
jgi:uncharacterized membrane protein